jgi:hypothetical protein
MKNRLVGIAALAFMLAAFLLAAVPARAQDADQRIQALENELQRLKSEQAQVRSEQIEMKKQATAAEAALPTFSYRPGGGMLIEAADKSWSFRASLEAHFRLLFETGKVDAGRETGGIMGRRFRPMFFYCVNDCFYEMMAWLDMDGFGTGNAKNSTNTGGSSIMQRGTLWVHLEKLNPWLPAFYTGMDGEAAMSSYRQGSSSTGAQQEYDMLSRNNGFNTGRWGNGFGLNWQDKDLSGIGIPGRIPLLNVVYATIGEGDDGLQSFRLPRSVSAYFSIEPLAQVKNKWVQGLGFEFGSWFCHNTNSINTVSAGFSSGCTSVRIQDNGDGGRQTLFASGLYGNGLTTYFAPGFAWTIGPYRLRAVGGFQRDHSEHQHVGATDIAGTRGDKKGNMFLIGHDLFVWSPKGFLTGSSETPGTIQAGFHFEREDVSCGFSNCAAGSQFSRNRIMLREWNLWYYLMNRMSVGATWAWYDASNLRTGAGQALTNLNLASQSGPCGGTGAAAVCRGRGGDWVDFSITWRYQF